MNEQEYWKKFQPLTNEEKEKIDELINRGWVDVSHVYWKSCLNRNYAYFLVSQKGGPQMYKNDRMYTELQEENIKKLADMKLWDVLKIYRKHCEKTNYTEAFRLRLELGLVEGMGFEDEV